MRLMLSLAAAALAAAGLAAERAAHGPDLQAVDAPARAIGGPNGTLVGAEEFGGRGRLLRLRPETLRAAPGSLLLRDDFVWDHALSPDGARLAVGSGMHNHIELFDLRRWRSLGTLALPGPHPNGYGGASGLAWVSPRRLLVLAGAPWMGAGPVVVDPIAQRVVRRSRWRGAPLRWETAGGRLVFLAAPSGEPGSGPGPARLVRVDASGRLRQLRLKRIAAGSGESGPGPARDLTPALALDRAGRRAYVVAAEGQLVAEVDLRSWRLEYHELSEPTTAWQRLRDLIEAPAHAKGEPMNVVTREAEVLANGAIAVTGEDWPATESQHRFDPVPFGVRLIDPATWTVQTVDGDAQGFDIAGGMLLARRWSMGDDGLPGIGLRAYDSSGELRFARFEGADTIVRGAAGRRVYVEVKRRGGARSIHVLELATGRTVRVLPWREMRVLGE